jgi:acyl dehydratase
MWFEDFTMGQTFRTGGITVSEAAILDFAFVYDPQPMHIDAVTAGTGPFGGLIASGFQTLSLSCSLFFRLGLVAESNLGSPGMDELRWTKPLRPGDTIRAAAEVIAIKPSASKPDRGVITMRHDTFNQRDELILTMRAMHLLKRCLQPAS